MKTWKTIDISNMNHESWISPKIMKIRTQAKQKVKIKTQICSICEIVGIDRLAKFVEWWGQGVGGVGLGALRV